MLAYYKKLPKVMVSAPTKKESVSKAIAEKTVKGSSGAGEGGKGAKDLQGTVEMLEQRVKTLEVIEPCTLIRQLVPSILLFV
jgi:hypothetical protein